MSNVISEEINFFSEASNLLLGLADIGEKFRSTEQDFDKKAYLTYDPSKYIRGKHIIDTQYLQEKQLRVVPTSTTTEIRTSQNLAENYTSTHFWDLKVFIWFIKEETYLDFSENNQINIEDTETFHRIPRLAHHLEQVVHRPGIYHIDEIAKLQKDKGQFLRKVYQTEDLDLD